MRIRSIIWIETLVEKFYWKHGVSQEEVRTILQHPGLICFVKKGKVKRQDVYSAMGRTTAGRYLIVYFVSKPGGAALPISARQMTQKEKRLYARKGKTKD